MIEKTNKTKNFFFFDKEKKIDKILARLFTEIKSGTCKIRNHWEVTTNITKIQRLIREYYQQLFANELDSQEEMDTFLETYNLPGLNQKK